MKIKILLFSITIVIISIFNGCKKYEEGPLFSLSSKKARVVNTWKYAKVFNFNSGSDYTSQYSNSYLEFKKDGTSIQTDGSSSVVGKWDFATDKENIILTGNGSSISYNYQIRRLTSNELWLRGEVYEYHLASK